jgi:hypothetical protein
VYPRRAQKIASLKERAVNVLRVGAGDGLVDHRAQLLRHEGVALLVALGRLESVSLSTFARTSAKKTQPGLDTHAETQFAQEGAVEVCGGFLVHCGGGE